MDFSSRPGEGPVIINLYQVVTIIIRSRPGEAPVIIN